jgi:chromosome segregation ATPase
MGKAVPTLIFLVSSALLAPAQSSGETPAASTDCQQVADLTVAIHELVSEIRNSSARESRHQDLLIAIQYLQFRSRSIESLEEEVRSTQDRRDTAAHYLEQSKTDLSALEDDLAETTGEQAEDLRSMIERYERRIAGFEAGIDRHERKVIDLENQIVQSRRQLLALEEYVIENLNLEP